MNIFLVNAVARHCNSIHKFGASPFDATVLRSIINEYSRTNRKSRKRYELEMDALDAEWEVLG